MHPEYGQAIPDLFDETALMNRLLEVQAQHLWEPRDSTFPAARDALPITAFFDRIAERLVTNGDLASSAQPRGVPHPEWPSWAKSNTPEGGCPGRVYFKGDEPYDEPTPRQVEIFHDFDPDSASIRLRTESVRDAIDAYMMPEDFDQWLNWYVQTIAVPAHFRTAQQSLDNITMQFNLRPPHLVAPDNIVHKYLGRGSNLARYILGFSTQLDEAAAYPAVVLALALYQGAHMAYINNLQGALEERRYQQQITWEELQNAQYVLEHPFNQFDTFVVYATLLPLILLCRKDLAMAEAARDNPAPELALTHQAIGEAWNIFIQRRLLRRDFDDGRQMICPANHHLLRSARAGHIQRIHEYIMRHAADPPMTRLLYEAHMAARNARQNRASQYLGNLGRELERNRDSRGGQGVAMR